jgi:ribose 5-phosphate isomerase B
MKVAIGSDHAGFLVKNRIMEYLKSKSIDVQDFGTDSEEPVDYPDVAARVGHAVADSAFDTGILVCGTGIGMAVTANKIPGIRAAVCYNEETARLSREHNHANILTLGARQFTWPDIQRFVQVFLETPFQTGNRHERRIKKIHELTQR